MSVDAFPWDRVPREERDRPAAAWVAALARARGRALGGMTWAGVGDAAAWPDAVAVELVAGLATAIAVVPGRLAIALADAALGRAPELAAPRPPTSIERALTAFALLDALDAAGVVAVAGERTAPVIGPAVVVAVATPVRGHLAIAGAAGGLAVPPLPWPAARERAGRLPAVRGRLELAGAPIAPRRLAGLAARDVVVVGPPAPRWRAARGSFAAALDPAAGRLTVSGPYLRAPMADPAELFADDALVALTVVVGEVALPARAVLGLEAGAVISTAAPVGGPVELRAGDRVVARGELVVVDGAIGVRVHDVLSTPPGPC